MDFTLLSPVYAEMFLAAAAIVLVLPAAFVAPREVAARRVRKGAIAALLVTAMLAIAHHGGGDGIGFLIGEIAGDAIAGRLGGILNAGLAAIPGGFFATSGFTLYMKLLVLSATVLLLLLSKRHLNADNINMPEFPLLVLFATLGMMVMISANDLMVLYMGLELQSLPLYVIAAMRRESMRASEAGLKYFLLGALSSGLLLYGISLVYGFAGSTNYHEIAAVVGGDGISTASPGIVVGIVFMLAGLGFKISAAPFHMWVPDVYEGAPTIVTAFFAVVPKLAAMALFLRVTFGVFAHAAEAWQQVVVAMAVLSMFIGALGAVMQTDLKRLMAYSSITHMGFTLVAISAATAAGLNAAVLYMTIYVITVLGVFAAILSLTRDGIAITRIQDLAGLSRSHPARAACILLFMFSMAGIPPLGGFFAKWFAFLAAVEAGLTPIAVLGVLATVVAAFYYLRIVKLMYIDDAPEIPLDGGSETPYAIIIAFACALALAFLVFALPGMREGLAGILGGFG